MKKILSILFCLAFTVNIVLAQDIFITLTKYDESAKKLPVNITVIAQKTIKKRSVSILEATGQQVQIRVFQYARCP
ncbi:hypothetical protein ATZ36_02825 [Candidatus Endomicrobiellum trichonymphae]|jgi:hypothetical protein|uniref:Uncharacterized protein n=1 Tax=Endomicrobium trichonymphae TaxID=1408204 RepID=A0A1E5ILC0_ENDTX|nr:hypothetical protein ATZ36_02825 [Candidatus Endomicrobium trichonymphae]